MLLAGDPALRHPFAPDRVKQPRRQMQADEAGRMNRARMRAA
jgi:hypothetical protein